MITPCDCGSGGKTESGRHEVEVFGGGYLDLLEPDLGTIRLEDVAHALSQIARFAGHASRFYSVAQHAVEVSIQLGRVGASIEVRLAGLHHDDSEAYLGDVSRPLKSLLPDYVKMEKRMSEAIREALGLDGLPFDDPRIKEADDWALAAEARHLLRSRGVPWAPVADVTSNGFPGCLLPHLAKRAFLELHEVLSAEAKSSQ